MYSLCGLAGSLALLWTTTTHAQTGVSAMTIGPAVAVPPTIDQPVSQWTRSPKLDQCYKVGGEDGALQPTQTRVAHDAQNLYVLYVCTEPNLSHPAHHRQLKLADHLENGSVLDTYFPDRVDLFIKPNLQQNDFLHLSATISGDHAGLVRGSALLKVLNPEGGGTVEKDKTVRAITGYQVEVKRGVNEWRVLFRVPWTTLGMTTAPTGLFGLLPTRTRWRTSERSSPVAMDFDDKPAPDLFIETTLSTTPAVFSSPETLAKLPSGVLRWQRPTRLVYPSLVEKRAIWTMQQTLDKPTSSESNRRTALPERIRLTQRWIDLLVLEGFNFNIRSGAPIPQSLFPYAIRRAVNQALVKGQTQAASDTLDAYLAKLNPVSRNWFADESAGNIRADAWQTFALQSVDQQQNEVVLTGRVNQQPYALHLSFPTGGGVRLSGKKHGFFTPQQSDTFREERVGTERRFTAAGVVVSVKTGVDWQITIGQANRPAVVLDAQTLRFRLTDDGKVRAVRFGHALDPTAVVQGFGERFDRPNLNRNTLTLWGMDDFQGLTVGLRNQTYKPIPFYHVIPTRSNQLPFSVFVNSSYRLRADLGQSESGRANLDVHGPVLDLFIWPLSLPRALEQYTNLTGKPLVPPRWAFEPWMGRTGKDWTRASPGKPANAVLAAVRRMIDLKIPVSAVYAEGPASDDTTLHNGLHGTGVRPMSWANSSQGMGLMQQRKMLPGVPDSLLPLVHHADGRLFKSKHLEYVDFTHPQAPAVMQRYGKKRLDLGIAGSMVDFGDELPEDAVLADGRRGDEMHNFYAYDYHRQFAKAFEERRGDDYVLFARAASAGDQRWITHFAGDHRTNFTGLQSALTGALHLSSCGFSIWSTELGGFFGLPDPKLYSRWVEFSTFSPLMRMHGTEPREPWEYGDAALAHYKVYANVRARLVDYLHRQATESHRTGLPMMRSMAMAFPDQPGLATINNQYLLGTDLLVAPVLDEGDTRPVTLPKGRWTNFWTGDLVEGGQTQTVAAPLGRIPVYVRDGVRLEAFNVTR
ncbi:MAG: hypothetical protein H7Z72_03815 [Bacteroidetes bacterium]|nr:hypothetical protein [Fibrella sp.]